MPSNDLLNWEKAWEKKQDLSHTLSDSRLIGDRINYIFSASDTTESLRHRQSSHVRRGGRLHWGEGLTVPREQRASHTAPTSFTASLPARREPTDHGKQRDRKPHFPPNSMPFPLTTKTAIGHSLSLAETITADSVFFVFLSGMHTTQPATNEAANRPSPA